MRNRYQLGNLFPDDAGKKWAGWLMTDGWSAYGWVEQERRQVCWSHVLRDFQGFVDRGGEGKPLGEALLERCRA